MSDLTVGVASALSPLVRRVIAPNPGLMTGPGTNTYLVGIDEVAVIDPGPADAAHIEAIIGASMSERVSWVLLTHTHPDHWPAARDIAARTGARIAAAAKPPKADAFDLKIDRVLTDGDVVEGTEFGLQALVTPGHAPNHLCFFLEDERALFTGDHVLDGTTTVVNPERGGDMRAYLESLARLRAIPRLARVLPGHGDVIDDPVARLDEYAAHRAMRERQILALLAEGPAKIARMVAQIYVDTPEGLLDMAARQVYAHLLKLRADGKVAGTGKRGTWTAV